MKGDKKIIIEHIISWEKLFYEGIKSGRDFIINPSIAPKNMDRAEYIINPTVMSALFGPDPNDPEEVRDLAFTCRCGTYTGKKHEGNICEECGKVVVKKEFPLTICGWFDLGDVKIISGFGMLFLSKCIQDKYYKQIISNAVTPKPIAGKWTFLELYDNFEEFIEECKIKSKTSKRAEKNARFLIENKDKFFSSKIPVISKAFRYMVNTPIMSVSKLNQHDINPLYHQITILANSLKTICRVHSRFLLDSTCRTIQSIIVDISDNLLNEIGGGKDKWLRSAVLSTRIPDTVRAILIPLVHQRYTKSTDTVIHYDMFRSLFKKQIKTLMRSDGYIIRDIVDMCDINKELSDRLKSILRGSLFDRIPNKYTLVSREPCIDFSSVLSVEIVDLSDDKVIQMPSALCARMRADYDGDEITIIKIPEDIALEVFNIMHPYQYMTSYDRKWNKGSGLINDQALIFMKALSSNEEEEICITI
ncbi:MAG: hypothetical protein ACRCZ9_12240 [Fusobacteriaceae bacterium]